MAADLLLKNRERKADATGNTLHVSFPSKEKQFMKSLGGFLKLIKSKRKDRLTGLLMMPDRASAQAALSADTPDGVILKQASPRSRETDKLSLKMSGIPDKAGIVDVASLFPAATMIQMKEKRRCNFLFGSDQEFRQTIGQEAVVRFDDEAACGEAFLRSEGINIKGHEVVVTFGQKNKKVNKGKRQKQRQPRRRTVGSD